MPAKVWGKQNKQKGRKAKKLSYESKSLGDCRNFDYLNTFDVVKRGVFSLLSPFALVLLAFASEGLGEANKKQKGRKKRKGKL